MLDEMSTYEAGLLIDAHNESIEEFNIEYKDKWIAIRWLGYVVAASNGVEKIKSPEDLMKFNWEKQEAVTIKYTQEEIKAIQERMLNKINEKNVFIKKEIMNG